MDIEKRIHGLKTRLDYVRDISGHKDNENVRLLAAKLAEFEERAKALPVHEVAKQFTALEDFFTFVEKKLDRELTPMDKVRIVRHPQRICLRDILENVYDNYTELGGQDEYSIDPSMLIARAYITRRVGGKVYNQPVMVIGQEKGHGQEFRNGGSVKPWGNAKAQHYMKVAQTENIPIHTYIFTPGSYPIEEPPGAAQQIARNLYEMAGLSVPIVACISEGGSGGAEAIGLADARLMLSHGYYSVISPEGAAAIEGRLRQGQRAPAELIEACAKALKITADDNRAMGYVDRVVPEPPLGARPEHYDFFKLLRQEMIRATDSVVLSVRGWNFFRMMALRSGRGDEEKRTEDIYVRWSLSAQARERLIWRRYMKFRRMSRHAYLDPRHYLDKVSGWGREAWWSVSSFFKYDFFKKHQKKFAHAVEEIGAEVQVLKDKVGAPLGKVRGLLGNGRSLDLEKAGKSLTELSCWEGGACGFLNGSGYLSPQARDDRTVTCPRADEHGCLDLWAPELFGDSAGVCAFCGHHFPMESQWYLHNVFDRESVFEFNKRIESGNPLSHEGLAKALEKAKRETGQKCSCLTFEAKVKDVRVVVAMLTANFRGGSVGAAEGEKFIRAADRARKKHYPFLAYVHGTAGIRIQEGVNGVIQMPRCTLAVRRYMEEGGLYVVLYDHNSYAGPVASFLGCSPYQFAVRSANIGFAGPGVIKETTGIDIPPDYHDAHQALSRGHIVAIWDRREIRENLYQALLTMGGRNLYYR